MINHELITIATAAAPFTEVDGAILLGIKFGFMPFKAYALAVFGNLLPLIPLLWFWGRGVDFLSQRSQYLKKFFEIIFARTRALSYSRRVHTAGLAAMVVLLALPLPFVGAYTMTVLAFLFGFPFWKSFYAIALGVVLGGLIVLGITLGVVRFI